LPVCNERVVRICGTIIKIHNLNFHCLVAPFTFVFTGKNVKYPHAEEIVYTIKERQYVEAIEKAYHFASITLLNLLMQENDLMGRLRYVA
jgi:hypothetical protein